MNIATSPFVIFWLNPHRTSDDDPKLTDSSLYIYEYMNIYVYEYICIYIYAVYNYCTHLGKLYRPHVATCQGLRISGRSAAAQSARCTLPVCQRGWEIHGNPWKSPIEMDVLYGFIWKNTDN